MYNEKEVNNMKKRQRKKNIKKNRDIYVPLIPIEVKKEEALKKMKKKNDGLKHH